MNTLNKTLKWWYLNILPKYFEEKVLGTFIYSMNKTKALPFAKTFNIPLYRYDNGFGNSFSMVIKFWWISIGTIISIIRVIPTILIMAGIVILPLIPILGFVRLLILILNGDLRVV